MGSETPAPTRADAARRESSRRAARELLQISARAEAAARRLDLARAAMSPLGREIHDTLAGSSHGIEKELLRATDGAGWAITAAVDALTEAARLADRLASEASARSTPPPAKRT